MPGTFAAAICKSRLLVKKKKKKDLIQDFKDMDNMVDTWRQEERERDRERERAKERERERK